jgi:hypothetical protein
MKRWDIINALIKKNNYKNYLEIGYGNGDNFKLIDIDTKTGVDPNPEGHVDYRLNSDAFFNIAKQNNLGPYDIIFIDGNHNSAIVRNDLKSSLEFLSDNGTIVMHDCNPTTEKMQRCDILVTDFWTGDVWKVFAEYRINRTDLKMFVVDTDFGCGVIQFGNQETYKSETTDLSYDYFDKNKKQLMNLITIEEFKQL